MPTRIFSDKSRPFYMGPYPTERLARRDDIPDLRASPGFPPLDFRDLDTPHSLVNAMGEYQAMMDVIRDSTINPVQAEIPEDLMERSDHLKGFGYNSDASIIGICRIPDAARLAAPRRNPDIDRLAERVRTQQPKTLASGIEVIMADLKEALDAPPGSVDRHTHAIVLLFEHFRDPKANEPGCEWIQECQPYRSCLRSAEAATVIAEYLRLLGFDARAHSLSTSEVHVDRLAIAAGLIAVEDGHLHAPFIGHGFGAAAVTTTLELAPDRPLRPLAEQPRSATRGLAWRLGYGSAKGARTRDPFARRNYKDGAQPFERLKRVDKPTTFIDEERVARVPKRTDMFARSLFGDMGKANQEGARGGLYVSKAAPSRAQRRALGAFLLLQDGPANPHGAVPNDARRNAENVKAASYFIGADAVGISRCPKWAWYSHDASGDPIDPLHDQAISIIIDQGYDTMEGASGDDWIAVSQSMRAYLRFSLLGGVIAQQIRNLGYKAKAHTVLDGEVLQPPLLLLSGLGEVSRIGEVILNPYLGPRLKSGVITTDMPLEHDRPIDFGLQRFCESCNKCARECPAGAITAGPKLMFNGYEIWKSDSQKCTTYRVTNKAGAMCGRCMKTCPWNLEGVFKEAPFRWAAMNIPAAAPWLAKLDDMVGNGTINPVKKWWWDLEKQADGGYCHTRNGTNRRDLQREFDLKYEDQTLAVYPANLAPHPWPFPFPMDREKGIEAYQALITANEYKARLTRGETDGLTHEFRIVGDAPVIPVEVSSVEKMAGKVSKYVFRSPDGSDLPEWTAGAHLDIVVAPEYFRQYSMCGNPADRSTYEIGVLREDEGRGGSKLLHRIFSEGRRIFISRPINHFPVANEGRRHILMGGGIGITPMIAMAHELHANGASFAMHYSVPSRADAGFLDDLAKAPWASRVRLHVSDEGTRADLDAVLADYRTGWHVYACGPDRYMSAVMEAAVRHGYPEDARHLEYFSVPEIPDYVNHGFTLRLAKTGRELPVPADKAATDVLTENGVPIIVKCSDGLCGTCRCGLIAGDVEHRDFVLSNKQRETVIILCQSRAAEAGGVLEIDL